MSKKITVKAKINKGIEPVWKGWTLPEHIKKWHFATGEWKCPYAFNDFKIGGKFSYRMEAKDGSMGFDFSGTYDEIQLNSNIEFTLDDGRKTFITFSSTGNATEIMETFEPDKSVSIEMQRAGWQSILNNFKKYIESNRPLFKVTERINAKAFELLEKHPEGLRWSELLSKIKASDPNFHPKTVNRCIWKLVEKFPDRIYKPSKGLFRLLKYIRK